MSTELRKLVLVCLLMLPPVLVVVELAEHFPLIGAVMDGLAVALGGPCGPCLQGGVP